MLRFASVIVLALGIVSIQADSAQGVEPFSLVLTDIEKNIYRETADISGSDFATIAVP